ncbi:MAG: hypothetical protein J7641_01885 [Cyanobacteria bacterium SID2]|nr:hypothetical protein [Cyanobacteria bacterium SID2]MBP0003099.1 hypothetical protein [Cyanobacteria bacterium SBC]
MSEIREYDYFGDRISWLDRLRMKSSLKIRRQIYDWFSRQIGGVSGKIFLDHGSTPDTEHIDSNCLIRWLLEDGATVYASSPENISHLPKVFPGLIAIPFPPQRNSLPPIDFVISSAVIEHVGSQSHQIQYLRDLLSLSSGLLLSTPNRYHWLDFHTKLPLVHWLARPHHRKILSWIGLQFWAKEENLRLLSKPDLARMVWNVLLEKGVGYHVKWYQPEFLGMVSNLVVLVRK